MQTLLAMKQIQIRSDVPSFLKECCLTKHICEVGVRYGYNMAQLLACNPSLFVGVDHWRVTEKESQQDTNLKQYELEEIYKKVFMRYLEEPSVRIYRGESAAIAPSFPHHFFDYIYVDADHSYEGALQDIKVWWNKVRQGGVLAGHDYIETQAKNGVEFGVIKAVGDFMRDRKIPQDCLHFTKEGYRSWFIFKLEGE